MNLLNDEEEQKLRKTIEDYIELRKEYAEKFGSTNILDKFVSGMINNTTEKMKEVIKDDKE